MSSQATRKRILNSACALFAEKGYRAVTVAEICSRAKANIAAVNYHFHGKEELYREVWRQAASVSEAKYPSTSDEKADAYECLREYVKNRILAIFDEGPAGCYPRIINRELAAPSPISKELFKEFMVPRRNSQQQLIRRLLGPKATEQQVRICSVNVLSVYAFLNIAQKPREHMFSKATPNRKQLNELIAQTEEFVCSAVKGVRESISRKASK